MAVRTRQRPLSRWLAAFLLLCGVTFLAYFGANTSSAVQAVVSNIADDPTDPVGKDKKFRESMGFRADEGFIAERRAEAAAGRKDIVNDDLGVPLTNQERAEVGLRQRIVAEDAPRIRAFFATRGHAGYGGIYLDNKAGGVLTVLTTDDPTKIAEQLRPLSGRPDRVKVVKVERALSELQAVKDRMRGDREDLARDGVAISGFGIDERNNLIEVAVSSDPTRATQILEQRYGAGLFRVEQGTIQLAVLTGRVPTGVERDISPPFQGGQGIRHFYTAADGVRRFVQCTAGFNAYLEETPRKYYMLTAGHCSPSIGSANVWRQGEYESSTYLGYPTRRHFPSGAATSDAMAIWLENNYADRTNDVVVDVGDVRDMTAQQGVGADVVGEMVCESTVHHTILCGELRNKSFDYSGTAHGVTATFTYGRDADFDCEPGDSGGPTFFDNMAKGVISAKWIRNPGNDTCLYSHIFDVIRALPLTGLKLTP